MNRKISFLFLIVLFFAIQPVFTQDIAESGVNIPPFNSVSYFAAAISEEDEAQIPSSIRDNEYYLKSLQLNKLAQDTYEFGDYDASSDFAEEAIHFARLSDEFVAVKLIEEAKRLLDWADSNKIAAKYPIDYNEGKSYYEAGVEAHSNGEFSESIIASINAIGIFTMLESGGSAPLPKQYTVRSWASFKDCLWNIAGYSWVYGDSWKWRTLYEANKSKMPDPANPNLIEPGMVLDIPSIKGEVRQGTWDANRTYQKR